MNQYEYRLEEFLHKNNVQAEHLRFDYSCHSVEDAAKAANASAQDIVKNICLVTPENGLVVAIVKGEDRASTKRVRKALNDVEVRTATPEEILEKTGYPCGGVPSFGFLATFLIDPKVMERDLIYTGGGSEFSLVKIAAKELSRVNQGQIVRVRK